MNFDEDRGRRQVKLQLNKVVFVLLIHYVYTCACQALLENTHAAFVQSVLLDKLYNPG